MKAARHFVAHTFAIVVIALTNLVLGCAAGPVHVAPVASTSFAEMMMAEETANARRAAHFMRQTVRGGSSGKARAFDNNKLPEAYTQKSKLTVWPSQFHLAYAARTLIREYYAATYTVYQEFEDDNDLVEVVNKAGGNRYTLHEFEKDCQLDIADVARRFVFEIVPPGEAHQAAGKKKVDWHLLLINNTMLGVPTFDDIVDLQWRVYLGTEERHTRKTAHLVGQTVDDA